MTENSASLRLLTDTSRFRLYMLLSLQTFADGFHGLHILPNVQWL